MSLKNHESVQARWKGHFEALVNHESTVADTTIESILIILKGVPTPTLLS